jgi:hypothetical protein
VKGKRVKVPVFCLMVALVSLVMKAKGERKVKGCSVEVE